MAKALITTVPFGDKCRQPLEALQAAGVDYVINPLGRKLKEDELAEMVSDFDVLIAGTETISEKVMNRASRLKLISRVGIGLDSVDLLAAKRRGIAVAYTPDAPAPAVAELTLGLMFSLLRSVHEVNARMHRGEWHRYFGRRIGEVNIGIVGVGRIGSKVVRSLMALGQTRLLLNDLEPAVDHYGLDGVEWVNKETLYRESDLISLHVPLTPATRGMIRREQIETMKRDVLLINTARGGIINEQDLAWALANERIGGSAIDVFEQEPYQGPLSIYDRCLLTSHMGSMSVDCRTQMEVEATEEAIRFLRGEPLLGAVPQAEYDIQCQKVLK